MTKRNGLILALAAGLAICGYLYWGVLTGEEFGFPLDDAWIHQTYARNIAEAGEWSFVLGQPSAGLTAPLWGVLLLPGYWLGLAPFVWVFLLSWLTLWGIGYTAMRGFGNWFPEQAKWSLAVGLVLVFEWHLVWAVLSGMETGLFAWIAMAVLLAMGDGGLTKARVLQIGGWIGLSVWVRPEGITLLGPLILLVLLTIDGWRLKLKYAGQAILGYLTLFLPYLLFNLWLAGSVWPNTFFAKQAEYAVLRELPLLTRLGQQFLLPLVGVGVILLPGFIVLLFKSWRQKQWAVLMAGVWSIGHLVMYALRLPVTYQHGRYVIPAMPVFFVLGLAGTLITVKPRAVKVATRVLSQVWLLLIPIVLVMFLGLGADAYAQDVAVINQEMVRTAKWIEENTAPNTLIAAHDIGALGYFAQRPLVDLAGLVSPEVIPFIRGETALAEFLDEQQPAYLVTFPGWYPELVSGLEIVFTTDGVASFDQGGENMAVYVWSDR